MAGEGGAPTGAHAPGALRRAVELVAFVAVAGVVLYLTDIGCVFRTVTGIPCPGCGMTRAWLAALRFDFAAALAYHPLFWTVPFMIALVCVQERCGRIVRRAQLAPDDGTLAVKARHAARVRALYHPTLIVLIIALLALWIFRLINPADAGFLFGGVAPAGVPKDVIFVREPFWLAWFR